jgi:hypothetical protein
MGRPAKALSVLKRTVGSNPTLSAIFGSFFPLSIKGFSDTDSSKAARDGRLDEFGLTADPLP